jgi:hypothetical protein
MPRKSILFVSSVSSLSVGGVFLGPAIAGGSRIYNLSQAAAHFNICGFRFCCGGAFPRNPPSFKRIPDGFTRFSAEIHTFPLLFLKMACIV